MFSRASLALVLPVVICTALTTHTAAANTERGDTVSLADACATFDPGALPHDAETTAIAVRPALGERPAVCIVRGRIVSSPASTINWAVELPAPDLWNGKTLTVGGGAFDGFIPTDRTMYQERIGPSGNPFVKLEVGTHIATVFYGRAPGRRYMWGHSNGGRSGLVAAQRFPGDYDGIVALAPAISQQAHEINVPRLLEHFFAAPDNWLGPQDIALFARAETAACDALDGLADGVISNTGACDYRGEELLCDTGEREGCLSAGQLESIRRIYTGTPGPFPLPDGLPAGYPRFASGGAATGDWVNYMFGNTFEARDSFNYRVGDSAANVVERNDDARVLSHNAPAYREQWERLSRELDPTGHDLSQFAANGGRLLVWYPTADACVSVYRTAAYFDALAAQMGDNDVRGLARLLASPGLGHDLAGPGAGSIDLLAALDRWVEQEREPVDLVASRYSSDGKQLLFERPVCEWPAFPRYDGSGDPADRESFTCSDT